MGLAHIMIRFATPEEMKAAQKSKKKTRSEPEALKLANQIYDRLQKGEKFEAVAKQLSEDELSKEQGGSLGPVAKNDPRFLRRGFQPVLEKAFTMKVGEIAGPIKTTSGYHIVTVTAPLEQAPFQEAKEQIAFKQRGEVRNKTLAELKEKGKVTYAEELKPQEIPAGEKPMGAPTETPPHPQSPDHTHEPSQH